MKAAALAVALLAGCASLTPGLSNVAEVEAAMGRAAERRNRPDGETWLYFPSQPFGRKVFVARIAPEGELIGVEQRLSEEYIARLVPNHSRRQDVLELFGSPYERLDFPRMNRETWSWHMRQFGTLPVGLHVQMSPDGVVREIYLLDENNKGESRRR